jgi:hypothetical protein
VVRLKVKEFIVIRMGRSMKVVGRMICSMGMALKIELMVPLILDTLKKVRSMDVDD